MKKIVSALMSTIMVISALSFTSVSAASPQHSSSPASDYYMIRGQIDLEPIADNIYVENGTVKISGKETVAAKRLASELEISPNLNDVLAKMIEEGLTPVGVGYTIVELKEVIDENGIAHLEPMTNDDVRLGNGPIESKGNLRLFVSASKTSANKVKTVTTAQWTTDFQVSASNRPAAGYDMISVTAPRNFQYASSYFTSTTTGFQTSVTDYFRADMEYSSVVYKFMEFASGVYSLKEANVWMDATGTIGTNNNLFIGKYCHTWTSAVPSFSILQSGVSFSLTTNSWNIPCEYFYPL